MKPLITLILLTLCHLLPAQIIPTLEPAFLRPGVFYSPRTDKHKPPVTMYGHAWGGVIAPHAVVYAYNAKIGAGIAVPDLHRDGKMRMTWLAGVNYQHNWQIRMADWFDLDKLHPLSVELGFKATYGRLTLAALTDPWNWESCFGVWVSPRWKCPVKVKRDPCPK